LRFLEIFRSDFRKYFYGVFGLLMQRNGQKHDKKRAPRRSARPKSEILATAGANQHNLA
jgi:hypothetical protein